MGTVVFPDADLKIFLKADARTRAIRRWKELMERGVDISFDDVYYQIGPEGRKGCQQEAVSAYARGRRYNIGYQRTDA